MQLLCAIYILVLTFADAPLGLVDPKTGTIIDVNSVENTDKGVILVNGDYRAVVAQNTYQMLCLAVSRMSAFSMYPVMGLVFFTKCKALRNFLNNTPYSMYMIPDDHKLHIYAGKYIAFDVWIHVLFHLLRWIDQGNLPLLWESCAGISGFIVIIFTPAITFPMMYWKQRIPYEIRKGLHYFFYVFAVGMCFHTPTSGIPNGGFIAYVLGFCIILYFLDSMYVTIFMTEKIETTIFQVLPSGVQMSMDVSEAFQKRGEQGGFAYVCLPWVDRNQWHAFSLFENLDVANRREVFMLNSGDWTNSVHKALKRNTVRPVWVCGPFASPYNNADSYDNQILVATGIGITPALSVIRAHKGSRRINLIWAVRDAAMLEFFMERLYLDHSGWNLIFYTGNEPLNPALEELNTNVRVIKSRPNLHVVIPNIIYGIESATGLPETYLPSELESVKELLIERIREFDSKEDMTDAEKLKNLTALARNRGFLFTELLHDLMSAEMNVLMESTASQKSIEVRLGNGDIQDATTSVFRSGMRRRTKNPTISEDFVLDQVRELSPKFTTSSRNLQQDFKCPTHQDDNTALKQQDSASKHRRSSTWASLQQKGLSQYITTEFNPWEEPKGFNSRKNYVKNLDENTVLSTWGILYCGGSPHVERALKRVSEEYHVALNTESFYW